MLRSNALTPYTCGLYTRGARPGRDVKVGIINIGAADSSTISSGGDNSTSLNLDERIGVQTHLSRFEDYLSSWRVYTTIFENLIVTASSAARGQIRTSSEYVSDSQGLRIAYEPVSYGTLTYVTVVLGLSGIARQMDRMGRWGECVFEVSKGGVVVLEGTVEVVGVGDGGAAVAVMRR